jgi:GTP-binding protein
MLEIKSAEIITSATMLDKMPGEGLPEVALLGRSNVGKSSLINALLRRRNLARTSSQPGKTRLFNFYLINAQFYLVDMPGYGYARFSQEERNRLRRAIQNYVHTRSNLKLVLQLVDFRHTPSENDVEFNQLLRLSDVPFRVVATKEDKIGRAHRPRHTRDIRETLGLADGQLLVTSSTDRTGLNLLWESIMQSIEGAISEQ